MCGISFCLVNDNDLNPESLTHRGPDAYNTYSDESVRMDFHRLKINDVSDDGNQPMKLGNYYLICNGEIFNHKEIETVLSVKTSSKVIAKSSYIYSKLKHAMKKGTRNNHGNV